MLKLHLTYELVPDPVPVLDERGGDDEAVDEGEQHGPVKKSNIMQHMLYQITTRK